MQIQNPLIVLFGGTSSERLVAVASAQHIASKLPQALYWYWTLDGQVLEVSREELLAHQNPFKASFEPRVVSRSWSGVTTALDDAKKIDAVLFLSLHGGEGENGCLQLLLEERRVSFTGSGAASSAAAFDKEMAKAKLESSGILLAHACCVQAGCEKDFELLKEFFLKHKSVVAKPQRDGSSVGLAFLDSEEALKAWWQKVSSEKQDYIVEERVLGREFTVGVVNMGLGDVALPVSEVVITNPGGAFDYDGKYLGRGTREITPAEVTPEEQALLQRIGLTAHRCLSCVGYSRTDVIMGPRGAYFLETNTLPGLTRASFIPQQLVAAGISIEQFIDAQIELALRRYL